MTINERVRDLRKTYLGFTMEEFGKKVGVGKSAISDIENGRNGVSGAMFNSICREFNVRPEWLRDGEGDPFRQLSHKEQIENFFSDILTNDPEGRKAQLISALASLDENGWDVLYNLALRFLQEEKAQKEISDEKSRPLGTPKSVAAAEAAYEKHYGIALRTEQSASNTGEGIGNA